MVGLAMGKRVYEFDIKELPVGTKFKVKDDLEAKEKYENIPFTKSMLKYTGKILISKNPHAIWNKELCVGAEGQDFVWSADMIEYIIVEDESLNALKKFQKTLSSMNLEFSVKENEKFNRIVNENNKKVARLNSEGYHTNSDFNRLCTANKIKLIEAMDEYTKALKAERLRQAMEEEKKRIEGVRERLAKGQKQFEKLKPLMKELAKLEDTPEVSVSNAGKLNMLINRLEDYQFEALVKNIDELCKAVRL